MRIEIRPATVLELEQRLEALEAADAKQTVKLREARQAIAGIGSVDEALQFLRESESREQSGAQEALEVLRESVGPKPSGAIESPEAALDFLRRAR